MVIESVNKTLARITSTTPDNFNYADCIQSEVGDPRNRDKWNTIAKDVPHSTAHAWLLGEEEIPEQYLTPQR